MRTWGLLLFLGLTILLWAPRSSAGERAYYGCTLQQVLQGGKDLVLVLGVEDGQVRQCGLEVAGQPGTMCRLREEHLKLEANRLSGPLHVQVGPHTEKITLDVGLGAGGTYQVAYGCPEPPRGVEGNVTIEAPKDAAGTKWVVWLEQAFGPESRLGLAFNVDRKAKTLTALPAVSPGYNNGQHRVDIAKLTFDGTNLEGEVGITVVPCRRGRDFYGVYVGVLAGEWSPAHGRLSEGSIRLRASLDGKDKAGDYAAVFGIEKQRQGQVAVKPATAARMRELVAPILSTQAPWRVWLATGMKVVRGEDGAAKVLQRGGRNAWVPAPLSAETAQLSELPPANWPGRDCDDGQWGRYGDDLADFIGGYGCSVDDGGGPARHPSLLCLRTRFGVSDPAMATDVTVAVEYLGGAVVHVNGVEVGRSHLPAGKLEPHTPATEYPIEAYTVEDGTTPLPPVTYAAEPAAKWLPRYQARVRTMAVTVPARLLVKGGNVLAVELHAAPVCGPDAGRNAWSHVGIRHVKVTSVRGTGVIPYPEAVRGTRVWSAQAQEQVTERPSPRSLSARNFFHDVGTRGMPLKGIAAGNPFEPLLPVRILTPRNGVGNAQTVLSDPDGLRGVRASISDLRGPGGALLPAGVVRVRFAAQGEDCHWCDALMDKPFEGATTIPVWLEARAPKDQPPGWYVGALSLTANDKTFAVPVQVFVTGFTVPDSRDFRSLIGVMHSPDSVADAYRVQPWSDAHFALLAKSLEMAGQLGNDILYVPIIIGTHMGHRSGLIRWAKTDKGLQPDFTAFEKYLDLYLRYCSPPKAIDLYVWSPETSTEVADAYEGRAIPTRTYTPIRPLQVTRWDSRTGETADVVAPDFLDEGAEAFWKPMLDGVHAIVRKRGWPERAIMLGCGGDIRPSRKTGEAFRKWAPYARWDIYSHFSGDPQVGGAGSHFHKNDPALPGSAPGKMIAIGDLEVGMKESPHGGILDASSLEKYWQEKFDFLHLPIHRCVYNERAGPMVFRTIPCHNGRIARFGLDFWSGAGAGLIWGVYPTQLARRGPDGPVPSVRLQMMREGAQDFEARMAILESLAKLPAQQQTAYRALLDDLLRRYRAGEAYLSQTELNLDWPGYVARVYRAAEELTGIKTKARWEPPPK